MLRQEPTARVVGRIVSDCPRDTIRAGDIASSQSACRLTGERGPGSAAVGATVNVRAEWLRHAGINSLCRISRSAGGFIEYDPGDTENVSEINIARSDHISSRLRKAGDLGPGHTEVGALPQTIPTTRSQIKNGMVIRINDQPLAHVAARHITAELKGKIGARPGVSLIGRAQNRSIAGGERICIRAGGHIDALWIDGIGRDTFNSDRIPIIEAHPVHERDPAAGGSIPAIGSADVGTCVNQILLRGVENDVGNVAASTVGSDVPPGIGLSKPRGGRKRDSQREHGEQKYEPRAVRIYQSSGLHT